MKESPLDLACRQRVKVNAGKILQHPYPTAIPHLTPYQGRPWLALEMSPCRCFLGQALCGEGSFRAIWL